MSISEIKKYLENIKKEYTKYCENKDEQSLFYINQMIDLFYEELLEEFESKTVLHNIVYQTYKKNIVIIFKNLKDYFKKISTDSQKNIDDIINLSASNRYLNNRNMISVYNTFSNEINKNLNIDNKIITLIGANTNAFIENIFTKLTIIDKEKIINITNKYQIIIEKEMISNVINKKEYLLKCYKEFIDTIMKDSTDKKEEIVNKNIELVKEVSYSVLKDLEYININNWINNNEKIIKETIEQFEKELLENKIIKKRNKYNPLKDYLLSFNNTIYIKIKKIFDDMNEVVYLEKDEINNKIKHYNDVITHVFEMNLVFDKQFESLKEDLSVSNKDIPKYNELSKIKNRFLTDTLKANIFNIFRENIKIYNNTVYKTMLLRSNINEYNNLLEVQEIKQMITK